MNILNSIALNESWDIAIQDNGSGLATIQKACDHRAVFQLVRTGLIANRLFREIENTMWIQWEIFLNVNAPFQLLAIKIQGLINSFDGVESVDLSSAEYNFVGEYLEITGICFVVDCAHEKITCEINV